MGDWLAVTVRFTLYASLGLGFGLAAFGWHCPDTGPNGSANCDPAHGGFWNQLYGMAKQWARYRTDVDKYRYKAGQTTEILWNVVESGCGGAPVTNKNQATAGLYNYTPYQPNAAALAAGLGHASIGSVDWPMLLKLLAGSLPGIWLGSRLMRHAPERIIRSLLSLLLAYAGIRLISI